VEYSFVRFESLGEFWRQSLNLLADIIQNPALDPQEVEGVRQEMLSLLYQRDESTYKTARRLFYQTLFEDHPFARSILGSKGDVETISETDLRWLHHVLYAPNNLVLSIVGGTPADSVLSVVSSLFSGMESVDLPGEMPILPKQTGRLRYAETTMDKEQAYIYIGDLLPGIENEETPAIRMMMAVLSERLGLELREKEGLAYSVGASAHFSRGFGWYSITMGTEKSNYRRAVDGIRREMDRLRSGDFSEEDLQKAINRTRGRELMKRLSSVNRAYFLGLGEYLTGDCQRDAKDLDRLRDVKVADIHRVARQYLSADRGVLVAVR
jgi:zinc protease